MQSVKSLFFALLPLWIQIIKTLNRSGMSGFMIYAVVIGIAGGLSASVFREAQFDILWLTSGTCNDIVELAEKLPPWLLITIPTLGGLVAGFFLWLSHRVSKQGEYNDYLEAIQLGNGAIPIRSSVAKLFSSLISITSGASIGREGGMVQLASLSASCLGKLTNPSVTQVRLMVACGAAAGMSAAYNTPIAGALFIAEIVVGTLAIEALGPLLISSWTANIVMQQWLGMMPVFDLPEYARHIHVDLDRVFVLGVLAGVFAPTLLVSLDLAKRFFHSLALPIPLRLALGGMVVGVISIKVPEVWGNGHQVAELILSSELTQNFVLLVLVMKLLATAASFGSGTVGGIFTPTLMMGASMGWLYSQHFDMQAGTEIAYAAVGMGALLSATTLAPFMAIVMVFELTLDTNLIFPLGIACLTARYVAAGIRDKSVYQKASGLSKGRKLPFHIHAGELLTPKIHALSASSDLADATLKALSSASLMQWVVDEQNVYQGCLRLDELPAASKMAGAHKLPISSCINHHVPTLMRYTHLTDAYRLMFVHSLDRLPLLDENGVLLGEVRKRDIFLTLSFSGK